MIAKDVWMRVEAIRADHQSGAGEIAYEVVDIFRKYLETTNPKERSVDDLRQLSDSLAAAQPAMAPVRNVARMCSGGLKGDSWGAYPRVLDRISVNLREARRRVAKNTAQLIPTAARVLTLSYSSNVHEVVREASLDGKVAEVTVLESRPGNEGRRLARDLVADGLPTRLAVDALGPSLVGTADMVLIGADTLLKNGAVVNKIGSLGLAMAAKAQKVPFIVACELTKLDDQVRATDLVLDVERGPEEVIDPPEVGIHVLNIYFEVVPPIYITKIVTDRGASTPLSFAKRASRPSALWKSYLS